MNTALQASFDGIEKALATLIDSITSNDPSPVAALSLVAADDDLSHNLELLTKHQSNHELILYLRALSAALDAELTSLLTNLSSTRESLMTVPSTEFPSSSTRDVAYTELLDYATKISRYTQSSTVLHPASASQEQPGSGRRASGTPFTNHNSGDAQDGGVMSDAPVMNNQDATDSNHQQQPPDAANPALKPTSQEAAMLNPQQNLFGDYAPWPSEETMRRGILARTAIEGDAQGQNSTAQDEEAQRQQKQQLMDGMPAGAVVPEPGHGNGQGEQKHAEHRNRIRDEGKGDQKSVEEAVFTGLDLYNSDDED